MTTPTRPQWPSALIAAIGLTSPWFACSCFAAETKIETPTGSRRIDRLRVGDPVLSFDVTTQRLLTTPVVAIRRGHTTVLGKVVTDCGTVTGVTAEHPFWLPEWKRWIAAVDLEAGMSLVALTERGPRPAVVREVHWRETPAAVFNLTIGGEHANFFADGPVVHNKDDGTVSTGVVLPPTDTNTDADADADSDGVPRVNVRWTDGSTTDPTVPDRLHIDWLYGPVDPEAREMSFGMADTAAAPPELPWNGEDCLDGTEPFMHCHDIRIDQPTTLSQVFEPSLVVPGRTTLMDASKDPPGADPLITYYIAAAGRCWAWGHDPSYYEPRGCERLEE